MISCQFISFSDPTEKTMHDRVGTTGRADAGVAQATCGTHAAPKEHRDRQEQEMVRREIESTDKGIDKLVYELYGLSEEEIGIVEGI